MECAIVIVFPLCSPPRKRINLSPLPPREAYKKEGRELIAGGGLLNFRSRISVFTEGAGDGEWRLDKCRGLSNICNLEMGVFLEGGLTEEMAK